MKNITVSVSDEIYCRARVCAAHRATSVTELVRQYLLNLPIDPAQEAEHMQELIDASRGANFRRNFLYMTKDGRR